MAVLIGERLPRALSAVLRGHMGVAVGSGLARALVLVVSSILAIITTRLIIDGAGEATYGYVALVVSITSLLPFADVGSGAAVTNALATSAEPMNDPLVRRTLITSVRVLCASALVIVTAALLILLLHGWPLVLGPATRTSSHLAEAATVSVIAFAVSLPLAPAQRVLLGCGRQHLAVLCQGIVAPTTLILVLFVDEARLPPNWFAACAGLSLLVSAIVTSTVARRATGISLVKILLVVPRIGSYPGVRIRHEALPMFVIMLGLPIAFQSDRLVLSHASDAHQLAIYSLGAQLFGPFWAVVSTSGLTLWPYFARQRSRGESSSRALRRAFAIFGLLGATGAVALTLLGSWASSIVSNGHLMVSPIVMAGFGALLVAQSLQLPAGMYLTQPSGLRIQALTVCLMVGVNLALSVHLASAWGASGPACASAISVFAIQFIPGVVIALKHASGNKDADQENAEVRLVSPRIDSSFVSSGGQNPREH